MPALTDGCAAAQRGGSREGFSCAQRGGEDLVGPGHRRQERRETEDRGMFGVP